MSENASQTTSNTVTEEEEELKVGDKVRYVSNKNHDYYDREVMEVVKIQKNWTGNQITCSYRKG